MSLRERLKQLPPEVKAHPERYYEDFSGFWMIGILAFILGFLFAVPLFNYDFVVFSNDGPLGGISAQDCSFECSWIWKLGAWCVILCVVFSGMCWMYADRWQLKPQYWREKPRQQARADGAVCGSDLQAKIKA